jgi:ABC-2 type transport system permease protein
VNIYAQELRMARAAMIAWTLGLVLITLLFVSIYPVFSHDIDTTRNLLAGFPPQLRSMLGLSLETMDSFLGFYAYTFTYVGLIGAVQAMSLGLTMLSREQRSKTVDFLLTRPVSRSRIFASKLMASLTVLTITNLVLSSTTVLFAFMVGAVNDAMSLLANIRLRLTGRVSRKSTVFDLCSRLSIVSPKLIAWTAPISPTYVNV